MVLAAEWITHNGSLTADNRDYCSVALRDNATLYVIADGSTQSIQSGDLANFFVRTLADQFLLQPLWTSAEQVANYINQFSLSLNRMYSTARVSFLVLLDFGGSEVFTLHAGDCRLGRSTNAKSILWLTRPHTLANAIDDIDHKNLVKHDCRHILTRSLRSGHKCEIELGKHTFQKDDCLLLATDGFWAELDERQQQEFRSHQSLPSSSISDDMSCLFISSCEKDNLKIQGNGNFYLVDINSLAKE